MKISIDISEILSLISCASDYGFEDEVLFDAFSQWLENIPKQELLEEIDKYANWFISDEAIKQGYSEEDKEVILEKLLDFISVYIKNKNINE